MFETIAHFIGLNQSALRSFNQITGTVAYIYRCDSCNELMWDDQAVQLAPAICVNGPSLKCAMLIYGTPRRRVFSRPDHQPLRLEMVV
jgi:hypothetical protein